MSHPPNVLGSTCQHCGRVLVPPYAYITSAGRVVCLAKVHEAQQRWVEKRRAEGTLRREQGDPR